MKILFIKEKRSDSGIEGIGTYLIRVCKRLNELNIPYLVIYNDEDDLYKIMKDNNINVRILELPPKSFKNLIQDRKKVLRTKENISKLVNDEKITHINVHFPHLLQYIDKRLKIPIIATWHGAFVENDPLKFLNLKNILNPKKILNDFYRKKYVFNFDRASHVIVPSKAAKETVIKKYGVEKSKITINPCGVEEIDQNNFLDIKKDLKFNLNDKIVLCVGRETKDKGVEDFCKVANYFSKKKDIKFIFLGGYRDKIYHDYLVKKYGKNVFFLGMRKDIYNFYKSSKLFLFLSHRESFPIVLPEAMLFGLPLLTWDIIGVNEMFENGIQGRMKKLGDINGIIKDIDEILSNNNLYNKLSIESKKYSKNHLIEVSVDNLINIFKKF
tara:strand:- start:191 stop:1342 length:1152 start_codon:yes stop_codon:yes gene_type:complete